MVEVSDFEFLMVTIIGLIVGAGLVVTGVFPDGGTVLVFVSMMLLGFVTVRLIRGRKFGWR